jgi:uncharacterized membrane protein
MFDRPAFKAAGKANFLKNYWPVILVSLLLVIAMGMGMNGGAGPSITYSFGEHTSHYGYGHGYFPDLRSIPFLTTLIAIGAVAACIAVLFGIAIKIVAANPYQVGACRFFMENRRENAGFSVVGMGFSKNFGNVVLTQFLKDLYILLWTLLFIIPGIVKSYAYFCVPFILAENPDLDNSRVIALSQEMTMGYKGDLFVTDLSFILWEMLNGLTFGILGIFYLNPYIYGTRAEIYTFLRQNALEKGIATTVELSGFGGGWYNT